MDSGDRLLSFEIQGQLFAMPIAGVLEVADMSERSCIPSVPRSVACVVNYRGDALPVVRREHLLEVSPESGDTSAEHTLVLTDSRTNAARLGLDVDRVLGFIDGPGAKARGGDPVAERRPEQGRVAHILDPARLIERARNVIEDSPVGD
jgi:chemotaxis signal transduction protein